MRSQATEPEGIWWSNFSAEQEFWMWVTANSPDRTIGEQNVARVLEILDVLRLKINSADIGGFVGRKLYFCTRDGDVYLRRMRDRKIIAEN